MNKLRPFIPEDESPENPSVIVMSQVQPLLSKEIPMGQVSDGYHTFDELYHHRMILFAVICNTYPHNAWKSKLHADSTMYDNYFIVGITTDEGDYSYHYHIDNWNYFNVRELVCAPEWDGHQPSDISRLLSLINHKK